MRGNSGTAGEWTREEPSDNGRVLSPRLLEPSCHLDPAGPPAGHPIPLATLRLPLDGIVLPPDDRHLRGADDDQLESLATSLRLVGQLQAIGVRGRPDGRTYELLFGQRRLEAARRAGFVSINASIFSATDEQALTLSLVENLQRRSLTRAERVQGLRLLAAVHQPGTQPGGRGRGTGKFEPPGRQPYSFNGLARELSVTQPTIRRWVLLGQDATLLRAVESGELPFTVASFIAGAPEKTRASLMAQVKQGELPPGQVRNRVRALNRVERFAQLGAPSRFGDADATRKSLRRVLGELELIDQLRSDAERDLVQAILRETHRLLGYEHAIDATQQGPHAPCASQDAQSDVFKTR
jgi:hypothetical protein